MARIGRRVTKEIPGRDGQTMTFKAPSWLQLEQAERARDRAAREQAQEWGVDWIVALRDPDADKLARQMVEEKREKDPLSAYDRRTILRAGIVDWSIVDDESGDPIEFDRDAIDELDAPTADWAMGEIYELFRPRTEEERGNSSRGSTEP